MKVDYCNQLTHKQDFTCKRSRHLFAAACEPTYSSLVVSRIPQLMPGRRKRVMDPNNIYKTLNT